MSELSKALGNAGEPHRIEHEGKTFSFWLLDQPRKNALEKRLYQAGREAVHADRESLTPDAYAAELAQVREQYETGEYSFFGAKGMKLLQTTKGVLTLLEIITGETTEALVPLLAARGVEVNELLKTVMKESFGKVLKVAHVG